MAVEWFEAEVSGDDLDRLIDYDHHRFPIGDQPAVLITYITGSSGKRGEVTKVFAVHHGAAGRHPMLPAPIAALAARLPWRVTSAPPA